MRRAFRVLSLKLHPDKSDDPNAESRFRQLVSISDVLKDDVRRAKYDNILVNGLPDWKTGAYYVRRVRKLGLLELSILVSLLVTLGHYLCILAAYHEKVFTLKQRLKKKESKLKKTEADSLLREAMDANDLRRPSLWSDNLPLQVTRFSCSLLLIHAPAAVDSVWQQVCQAMKAKQEEESLDSEEQLASSKHVRKPRAPVPLPDLTDEPPSAPADGGSTNVEDQREEFEAEPPVKCGEWTAEEVSLLVKQTKKWPGGTFNRWEKIACALNRSVSDVTATYERLRTLGQTALVESLEKASDAAESGDLEAKPDTISWSQEDQKAFEEALVRFPRGTEDRWDKVASMTGKTKVRDAFPCLLRVF